jgi:DNA-binding MarR family transcriptional regulator
LERRNLVSRTADPGDRRRKGVALTSGRSVLATLDTVVREAQEEVLQPLSSTERATLITLLERLQPGSDRTHD